MNENIKYELVAYQKGTPLKAIKKLVKAMKIAHKKTMPGVTLCIIPMEVDFTKLDDAEKSLQNLS